MTENLDFTPIRSCAVVAHGDADYLALVNRALRRHGWDVYAARTGPEARRLARMLQPQFVLLDSGLPGESGWLTCGKLTLEFPGVRVILVAGDPGYRDADFADFAGAAALLDRKDGPAALLAELGTPLPV